MKHFYLGLLILILLLSLLVRVWDLTTVPPSLYWDEMDAGYQAYSILKTGKDYFGNTPGLIVQSFADYRAPLFIYSIIPFVATVGLEPLAVRLPAALFGVINVLLIYLLSLELFKSKKIALTAAFLVAFSPWNIQYSRMAFEATLMLSLFLGALLAFLKGFNNSKWWIGSGICFGLSMLTYNTAKLFTPLILVVLFLFFIRGKKLSKNFWIGAIILGIVFLTGLYSSFFQGGGRRFSEISVFTDPQIASQNKNAKDESRNAYGINGEVGLNIRVANNLFFNKLTYITDKVFQNYTQAFSTDFLFINGDPNLRHSPSKAGELHPIEFITIILGLVFLGLTFNKRKKENLLILFWLILAPIPAAITREGGVHATRLFFLFPVLNIISALGIVFSFKLFSGKMSATLGGLIIFILMFNTGFFINHYFGTYKFESAQSFLYGFSEAVDVALAQSKGSDFVIIDDKQDSALMNYLFDAKFDPAAFQTQAKTLAYEIDGIKSAKIGNIIFLDPMSRNWERMFEEEVINKNFILAVSARQFDEQAVEKVSYKLTPNQTLLQVIYYQSGAPAFYIIQNKVPLPKL